MLRVRSCSTTTHLERRLAGGSHILWMVAKSFSHHFESMGNHIVSWYYRGIESFQGFLGGAGFRPSTILGHHFQTNLLSTVFHQSCARLSVRRNGLRYGLQFLQVYGSWRYGGLGIGLLLVVLCEGNPQSSSVVQPVLGCFLLPCFKKKKKKKTFSGLVETPHYLAKSCSVLTSLGKMHQKKWFNRYVPVCAVTLK